MAGYYALLRAVNVGGRGAMKMEALRRAFEEMGFSNVRTFIASGNVHFEATAGSPPALQRKIEKGLEASFGRRMRTFVRTAKALTAVAAYNPYSNKEMKNASINVVFLDKKPAAAALRALNKVSPRTDTFRAHGREVYWLRRQLPGRPDYASIPLDRALGAPSTVRGLRTIQKMIAKGADSKAGPR